VWIHWPWDVGRARRAWCWWRSLERCLVSSVAWRHCSSLSPRQPCRHQTRYSGPVRRLYTSHHQTALKHRIKVSSYRSACQVKYSVNINLLLTFVVHSQRTRDIWYPSVRLYVSDTPALRRPIYSPINLVVSWLIAVFRCIEIGV